MKHHEGSIALYLKQIREAKGLSKNKLSKLSGVNRTSIISMEKTLACPKFISGLLMLKALGKKVEDFETWAKEKGIDIKSARPEGEE